MSQAALLLRTLRRWGVEVAAGPQGVTYRAPKGVLTVAMKAELSIHKHELWRLLAAESEVWELHDRIHGLFAAIREARRAGDAAERERLWAEHAELADRYGEAFDRFAALAGDWWVELIESRPARQTELAGMR